MPEETEPPVREFADRGTLWLLELPENLRGLLRLIAADLADKLDFHRAERINRSFVPDDLQKQEADLLYRVPFRRGRGFVWVYVLLEHQSKPDRSMGFRLLSYMVQLWQTQVRGFQDQRLPPSKWNLYPVVPIVFYTGKRTWTHALNLQAIMDVPNELQAFIPAWETLFLNLHQTPPDALLGLGEAVTLALRALQMAEEPKEALVIALREVASRLDALPDEVQTAFRKALMYLYLLIKHKREEDEQDELFAVLDAVIEQRAQEREEIEMTGAEV
ncbi:MAG TPA: Rpn family recombination-promoting nuclease/putative transposase, partial [Chthonomonadaceae bacterium]|nr:Rpn family recombination-promoting nuclease/putative transposase [Chthonomonadaceae bacterium]